MAERSIDWFDMTAGQRQRHAKREHAELQAAGGNIVRPMSKLPARLRPGIRRPERTDDDYDVLHW